MLLVEEGTAWLDDVTLETEAAVAKRTSPPRALTPRGLENLVAFTRLFGVVRHFHASDEAAAADWEAVAVNGADAVEGAKDAAELAARLEKVFLPLAPSMRVYPTAAAPQTKAALPEAQPPAKAAYSGNDRADRRRHPRRTGRAVGEGGGDPGAVTCVWSGALP